MIYLRSFVLCLLVLCVISPCPIAALDTRSGTTITVPSGSSVEDDLAAAGQTISVVGDVAGEVLLAGQSILVTGEVRDSVFGAGNSVVVTGPVGRSAWLAGTTVRLGSDVARNAALAGTTVAILPDARVGRDLMAAGTRVTVQGNVGRNLKASGNRVTISGTINGDAVINATNVVLTRTAVVRGDLKYTSPNAASIADGASVTGEITHRTPTSRKAEGAAAWFGWNLYWLLATLLFGVLLTALYPVRSLAAGRLARTSFWRCLFWGSLILLITPFIIVAIMITIIGIPLGFVLLSCYLILLFASRIYAGIGLGEWVLNKMGRETSHVMLSMLVGVTILGLLSFIPVVGGLISLIAVLVGLGAVIADWASWLRASRERREV